MKKKLLTLFLVLVVLGVIGAFVARRALHSQRVATMVQTKLEKVYGGVVSVKNVDVGLAGSSLNALNLYEAKQVEKAEPWFTVESLHFDISLWNILEDDVTPTRVNAKGATVLLRFNREGDLLTRFPEIEGTLDHKDIDSKTVPDIEIEKGQFIFRKEGEPDLVAKDVDARLTRSDHGLTLTGTANSEVLGKISLDGELKQGTTQAVIHLRTADKIHVTAQNLSQLPFVPASVWREVHVEEATMAAHLALTYNLASRTLQFLAELNPEKATVFIPSIGVKARDTVGAVAVDNDKVILRNVKGAAFEGTIAGDADMAYSASDMALHFSKVQVEGLRLNDLPASWKIPGVLRAAAPDGRLFGSARVNVDFKPAKTPQVDGAGKGQIRSPDDKQEPIEFDWRIGSPDAAALLDDEIAASELVPVMLQAPSKAEEGAKQPKYLDVNFKLTDVDLADFVKRLEVKLPFEVAGKLSFQVKASLPVDSVSDLKAYKVTGSAQVGRFVLGGVKIEAAKAVIDYDDGVLNLTALEGTFFKGDKDTAPGRFSGSGRLEVSPAGELRAQIQLDDIPLKQFAGFGATPLPIEGAFSSKLTIRADTTKLQQIEAFDVQGQLTSEKAIVYGVVFTKLSTPISLKDGVLKLADVKTLANGDPLTGSAEANTKTTALKVDLKSPKLRVRNIPTEQLTGTFEYRKGALEYKLEGKALGGSFEVDGSVPPDIQAPAATKTSSGHFSARDLKIGRLLEALKLQDNRALTGNLSVDLKYAQDSLTAFPTGTGTLSIRNLRLNDAPLANDIQSDLVLTDGQIRLRDVAGNLGQGTFRAQLAYNLRVPEKSWFTVNLDRVPAESVLAPWLGETIKGELQARIRGALGAEWSGTADLELSRGSVAGLDVSEWRLPISFSFAPSQARVQLTVADTSAQFARGRVTGRMSASWDGAARIEGGLRFTNLSVQEFLKQTIGPSQLGGGSMSGRLDFSGSNVRSIDDISGTVQASFSQTQALQLPVLSQIMPLVGMGPSTTFQKGTLRANIDRGALRIQGLSLEGNTLQLFLDGRVAFNGQLNLEVTSKTGTVGLPVDRLRLLGLRIPVGGPVPFLVLQEASTLLSNRVVYAHVGGTVHSPVIQPHAVPILTEEAVRYFLTQSNVPIPLYP